MRRISIVNAVKIALFAAVISVTAMISVPIPVPLTLQTFGVFAALYTLGGKNGSIAVALYIAIGAVGIPVFSGFSAGVGRLFDLTGGFIWGFLVAAVAYWICEIFLAKRRCFYLVSSSVSLVLIYCLGCAQFMLVSGGYSGFISALVSCVFPFILPDVVKISLAYIVSKRIKKATVNL